MDTLSYGIGKRFTISYDKYVEESQQMNCKCYRFYDNFFSLEKNYLEKWIRSRSTVYYNIPSDTNCWQPQPFSRDAHKQSFLERKQEIITGWQHANEESLHPYCQGLMQFLHFYHYKDFTSEKNFALNFYGILSLKDCQNPYLSRAINRIYNTLHDFDNLPLMEQYYNVPKAKIVLAPSSNPNDFGGSWDSLRLIYEGLDNGRDLKLFLNTTDLYLSNMCNFESNERIVELFDNLDTVAPVKSITINDYRLDGSMVSNCAIGKGFIWGDLKLKLLSCHANPRPEAIESLKILLSMATERSIDVISDYDNYHTDIPFIRAIL